MENGARRTERVAVQEEVRKRANIQWEARRMRVRAWAMLVGRATVGIDQLRSYGGLGGEVVLEAPAKSSLSKISTGLNQ